MIHKLHKPYDALLRSIDFFSQNLHLEQITQYGFKLFIDLVQPDHATLYLLEGNKYTPAHTLGYTQMLPTIPYASQHRDFAVLSGFIIEHRTAMEKFFESDLLDSLDVEFIMPLISGNELLGFIFYKGSNMLPSPDVAFMTRFNHMLNLSLEKACRFLDQKDLETEVNKRMFNLAFLSQTTKLLLSEYESDKIHDLCIDVVRELTSSSVTSILTPDPVTGRFITRAYKDIIRFEKRVFNVDLKNLSKLPKKVIYNTDSDKYLLEEIFEDTQVFDEMQAKYIVLLITDSVIGVITIGEPIGAIKYDSKILEQIENVAGLMHLALTNAAQFEKITTQRNFMERQATLLKKVNKSVKTINSSETMDELCQITMDTLQYAFGVEAGFIAAFKDDFVELKSPIGFDHANLAPICQSQLKLQANDSLTVSYTEPDLDKYFCESLLPELPASNCLVIAPIRTSSWQPKPLGCIVVLRTSKALREEQSILIESLANSIAPVIKQFNQIDRYKRDYTLKPEVAIRTLYDQYQDDKVDFDISYTVQLIKVDTTPFVPFDDTEFIGLDYVKISNCIVIFTVSEFPLGSGYTVIQPQTFEDIVCAVQELESSDTQSLHTHSVQS